jgi:hypothetical protein
LRKKGFIDTLYADMMLFLIFLIPIGLAVVFINYCRQERAIALPLLPYFLGMLLFLPSFILTSIIQGLYEPSYTGAGFYFYAFFHEHFTMLILCFGWMLLLRNLLLFKPKENILYNILAFMGGYYSLVNVDQYLTHITHLDTYSLFLLPVVNLSLVILGSLLLAQVVRGYGLERFGSLGGLIALPFAATFVNIFFFRNLPVPAVIGTVILAGIAVVFFLVRKDATA